MLKRYNCQDCNAPATAKRSNAKYCAICRLAKNLFFIKDQTKKCWLCDKKFSPIERNDVFCGTCDEAAPRGDTGTCAFCDQQAQLYRDDIKVCLPCLKDPAQRPTLLKSIRNRQRRNQRDYAPSA